MKSFDSHNRGNDRVLINIGDMGLVARRIYMS